MTPQPYSADAGLGAKLRRRYARLVHRRPARLALTQPTVSFTFDDAPASAATAAAILERHQARGTYYLCAGLFDETGHMGRYINAAEAADLAGRGHEIGCHSHGHIDAHRAGEVALLADSERNVTRLTALGGSARHFAFPYGEVSPVAKARLADRYGSLRGVHAGLVRDGGDLNQLPAVGIEGDSGEAVARQWIDRAVETHAWLILFTHDVSDTPSPWGCTPAALDRLAAHARAAGCALKTVGEVLDR
ncbi:polysaccharide deacetylase family protein [uncultured Brevundimonas sp.]|uniref:polysaccharide deacetylase family protein n=1 Tax=uncultured Brevundimonas sp. TaxID=213418 RepID=UPI0030EEC517